MKETIKLVEGGERLTEVWDEKYLKISALFELQKTFNQPNCDVWRPKSFYLSSIKSVVDFNVAEPRCGPNNDKTSSEWRRIIESN